jgi:DNA-binding MarR family transcriptional regulator
LSTEVPQQLALRDAIKRSVARDLSEQMAHYHQAIAEQLGLSMADHKALDLVCAAGSLTAGQLAELTNLTTGGVTGLVDRLEQAGLVRRERDPHDRRRVIVRPSSDVPGLTAIFNSLAHALGEVCAHYTDQELKTTLDFVTRFIGVLQAETAKLEQRIQSDEGRRAG